MSDDLGKMCRRLSKYAHAQLSATDIERIADRIEELEVRLAEAKRHLGMQVLYTDQQQSRAQAAEAKLAKAVRFAELAELVERCGHGVLWDLALDHLAELKGEKDE